MRKLKLTAIAALAVGLSIISACRDSTGPTTALVADSVHLAYGVQTPVPQTPITLTLEEIVLDNRCPPDVVCVTAGSLVTRVRVDLPGADPQTPASQTVRFSSLDDRVQTAYGYRLELISSLPPRKSTDPAPPPSAYWVALRVSQLRD